MIRPRPMKMLSSAAAAMKRRPLRQQLVKLSACLLVVAVLAIVYGQFLLQKTASAANGGAGGESEASAASGPIQESFIDKRKEGFSEKEFKDYIEKNLPDMSLGHNQPNKPKFDMTEDSSVRFLDTRRPSEQSVELMDWVRKMSTEDSMVLYEESDLIENPKEFLFPCAQDEYTLSDSIQESGVTGMIEGFGEVTFGSESLCSTSFGIQKASGKFDEGKLEGEGIITFTDGSLLKGTFKKGVLHGLARKFWCMFGPCDLFEKEEWSNPAHLWEVSWFMNGMRNGVSWEFKAGGGAVVGTVDLSGELTGDEIMYIYPDMHTIILGKFEDGVLVTGHESRLDKVSTDDYGLATPVPMQPRVTKVPFVYEVSNKTHITRTEGSRHLRDPYEAQYIEVRMSHLPSAGRGVFLKRPAKAGTIVGFYNGVRMSNFESKIRRADRTSSYRMDNDWAEPNQVLNIPEGLREPHEYNATLGHFVNHAKKANAWYAMIDHPRFGPIRSLVTLANLKTGTEILCDYGYVEKKLEGDSMFNTVLDVGKTLSGKTGDEFHHDMKHTVNYLKQKVEDYKPYLDLLKMGAGMMGGKGAAGNGAAPADGSDSGVGRASDLSPVVNMIKMGMGLKDAMQKGGGGGGGGSGGDFKPMLDMVKMGVNMAAGAAGSKKDGGKGGGDYQPYMDMFKMGMKMLQK